ncbi:MAG: hypothetical protein M3Q98_04430 [Actinomycetota bacterium]|nr:hypothetical protein [Actinomycetota bacterium]
MRPFFALVLGVCAVLATLVTVPATWVSQNIADEDGYVAFAEPIARDSEFHGALADALSESLVERTQLAAAAQPVAKAAILRVANQVSGEPGFVTAWNDTQRQSHKIMLGDQRDLPPELDSGPSFAIDLGPLGKFVVDEVNKNLPFAIAAPDQLVIPVNGAPQAETLDRIRQSPTYARNGLIAIALSAALALAFARRKSVAVAWLGIGAVLSAGVLKVAAVVGVPAVLDRNTAPSPFAKALLDTYVDRANASFGHWLLVLAIGGGVATAAGLVLRLAAGAKERA